MSGVTDFLFGEKQKPISQRHIVKQFPQAFDFISGAIPEGGLTTGLSTLDPRAGTISIDPTGRDLNLGALGGLRSDLAQQREALLGNKGAFMEARVNPLIETLTRGRGQLQRGLGRTGVRGSIGQRALQSFDIAGERALGDARALAEQETQNALNQITTQLFQGGTGVGTNIFNQELAALNLSTGTMQNLLNFATALTTGAGASAVSSANAAAQHNQARAGDIRSALGGLIFGV